MIVAKGTRTVVAWIACLAVLLASLAPTISQAFQQGGVPDSWMEVCSASGSRFVAVGDAGKDSLPAAPVKHLLQHCPYCSLHVTALGMPPTPLSVPALLPLGDAVPELMLQAPRTLFAWASAQPRAPPQFS